MLRVQEIRFRVNETGESVTFKIVTDSKWRLFEIHDKIVPMLVNGKKSILAAILKLHLLTSPPASS